MKALEIANLVLAILLIGATGYNIYVDVNFYGWVIYLSWVSSILNLMISIWILIIVIRKLSKQYYIIPFRLLCSSDFFSVFVFVMFMIYSLVNYAKIISIVITSVMIGVTYKSKNEGSNEDGETIVSGGEYNQQMNIQQS